MDTAWLARAYEQANDGAWSEFAAHAADDYEHHIPALNVHWHGREEALAGLQQIYRQLDLSQTATGVSQHGPFVIATIAVTSNLRAGEQQAVHVYREADGKIVEGWVLTQPPGQAG